MSISVGGYNHHPGYSPSGFPATPDFYPPPYTPSRYEPQPDSYMSWMLNPVHPHHESSPMDCASPYASAPANDMCGLRQYDFYGNLIQFRGVKRRVTANKKERRRTESINSAFANLRGCIPNVPSDTKLSKIKTLRLATSYISYLMELLSKDDPILENVFKVDLQKKKDRKTEPDLSEKRSREVQEPSPHNQHLPQQQQHHPPPPPQQQQPPHQQQQPGKHQHAGSPDSNSESEKRSKCRTGWPQTVWASELK